MGMPSRQRVLDFWREWLEEDGIDLLEPQCWCCYRPLRKTRSFKRLAKIDNPTWKEIRSAWNDCKELIRCHIIPDSLGGMPKPENIFLMCKRCHDKAPDTTSKEMFLRWVSRQYDVNRLVEMQLEFKKALHDFGVDSDEDIVELGELVRSKEFKAWALHKNVGIHFGPYGGIIKMSTMVAALLEYRNQLNRKNADQRAQAQLHLPFDVQ